MPPGSQRRRCRGPSRRGDGDELHPAVTPSPPERWPFVWARANTPGELDAKVVVLPIFDQLFCDVTAGRLEAKVLEVLDELDIYRRFATAILLNREHDALPQALVLLERV